MTDDRVTAIRRHLKEARSHVMRAAREADRWNPELHARLMMSATVLDDAQDQLEQVDTHLALIDQAYYEDLERERRREGQDTEQRRRVKSFAQRALGDSG